MKIKTLTQPSDPIIRFKLPVGIEAALKAEAKAHRRSLQDEVIKRLVVTLDPKYREKLKDLQGRIVPKLQAVYPSTSGETP